MQISGPRLLAYAILLLSFFTASLSASEVKILVTNSLLQPLDLNTSIISSGETHTFRQPVTTVAPLATKEILVVDRPQNSSIRFHTLVQSLNEMFSLQQFIGPQTLRAGVQGTSFTLGESDSQEIRRINTRLNGMDVEIAQKISPDRVHYVVTPQPRKPAATPANTFNLMVYNAWAITLFGAKEIPQRTEQMPAHLRGYDALVMSELFDQKPSEKLLNAIRAEYPYQTRKVRKAGKLLQAGNRIVSRWPVLEEDVHVYKACHAVQCAASRAVVYVKINKLGQVYHIFGTHTQSSDDQPNRLARLQQLQEMGTFVRSKNIPADEAVLLAGDFNINKLALPGDKQVMENILDAADPVNRGYTQSTFDGLNNHWAKRKKIQEFLDYALFSRRNLQPVEAESFIFAPRSTASELWGKWDLSDHYAIHGTYKYATPVSPARSRFPYNGDVVHLKSHNGHYLHIMSGGNGFLTASADNIGTSESFIVKQVGPDKIALQTRDGHYLHVTSQLLGTIRGKSHDIGKWDTFTIEEHGTSPAGNKLVALKAANGRYLRANFGGGSGAVVRAGSAREHEIFEMIRP